MHGYCTRSIWQRHALHLDTSAALAGGPYDACVIGAGIAGLSVAYQLARGGQRVLLLEDGAVGSGQTGRSSAHLSSVIDDRFAELERLHGESTSRLAHESHAAAIDAIEAIVAREGIDCAFRRVPGFLMPHDAAARASLHLEEAAARRAGCAVRLDPQVPLDPAASGVALRFEHQALFDPLAYLEGLARAFAGLGGLICTGVHVSEVQDGAPPRLRCEDGTVIEARSVVVATNSPVNDRVMMQTKLYPYLTYVVALEIPRGSMEPGLYWDTADPYRYLRLVPGGQNDRCDYAITGGEDHRVGHGGGQTARFDRLEQWTRERLPQAGARVECWSGQVLETLDGLAYIGRNPGERNVYIVTGDSGMGLTHGSLAGLLIAGLILDGRHAWEKIYDPARKPVKALREYLSENLAVGTEYAAWLSAGDVDDGAAIAAESGAIVRRGVQKLAVYRDAAGGLHSRSAVCPHLGAIVSWNELEKTWDCPAHGSRFDCQGRVIQGPANKGLEEVRNIAQGRQDAA